MHAALVWAMGNTLTVHAAPLPASKHAAWVQAHGQHTHNARSLSPSYGNTLTVHAAPTPASMHAAWVQAHRQHTHNARSLSLSYG